MKELFDDNLGILRAIDLARKMTMDRKPIDFGVLVVGVECQNSHYCDGLGEFTPSLEDVAMLTGLLMSGNAYTMDFLDVESNQRVEDLQVSLGRSKCSTNKATYLSCVKYFYEARGRISLIR